MWREALRGWMAWWFDGIHELDRESIPEVNKHWSIKPVLLQYWAQFSFLAARKKKNKQKKTRNETVPFHLDAHFSSLILINFFWVARLKLKKAVSDLFQSYFNQSLDYGALLRLQGRGFWPQKSILTFFTSNSEHLVTYRSLSVSGNDACIGYT